MSIRSIGRKNLPPLIIIKDESSVPDNQFPDHKSVITIPIRHNSTDKEISDLIDLSIARESQRHQKDPWGSYGSGYGMAEINAVDKVDGRNVAIVSVSYFGREHYSI